MDFDLLNAEVGRVSSEEFGGPRGRTKGAISTSLPCPQTEDTLRSASFAKNMLETYTMTPVSIWIGIDFGTPNSAVGRRIF